MGSGNVKLANTAELSNITKLTMTSCENCSTSFNIFRRKKECNECHKQHCTDCLVKEPSRASNRRRCNRCRILSSGTLMRRDLVQLKIKHLREFLHRNCIRTVDCKEKDDLVELILLHYGSDAYHRQRVEHDREVLELRERNLQDFSQQDLTENEEAPPVNGEEEDIAINENEGVNDSPIAEASSSEDSETPVHEQVLETDTNSLNNVNVPSTRGTFSRGKRMKIDEVMSVNQIRDLSVKRLKELLTENFVNYKGCCEKGELVDRVIMLWREHQVIKARVTDDDSTCKICMDAAIDCVLLECGHMVSCTDCGKRLAECPICRQYVVRVVHTFKA
ncbi:E3 ubiquitin-protein ligase RNF34-like [Tubulanus polymorphus]|uniref:E3 ubiquitin-protein ligase RNF34-like n=1 Tax=Tubulanus polymorphus TaxID=672921 RepID=UPI003DA64FFB